MTSMVAPKEKSSRVDDGVEKWMRGKRFRIAIEPEKAWVADDGDCVDSSLLFGRDFRLSPRPWETRQYIPGRADDFLAIYPHQTFKFGIISGMIVLAHY